MPRTIFEDDIPTMTTEPLADEADWQLCPSAILHVLVSTAARASAVCWRRGATSEADYFADIERLASDELRSRDVLRGADMSPSAQLMLEALRRSPAEREG